MNKRNNLRDNYIDFESWVDEYFASLLIRNNFQILPKRWVQSVYVIEYVKENIIISFSTEYLSLPTISIFDLNHKLLLAYSSQNCVKNAVLSNIEISAKARLVPKVQRFSNSFINKGVYDMEELKEDYNLFGYAESLNILKLNSEQLEKDLIECGDNLNILVKS